jgi:hypothetical protein
VQRRITSIDARGRQQYRQCQVLQLALLTLDLIRSVWRMPPYRRRRWPRRGPQARQIRLFEPLRKASQIMQDTRSPSLCDVSACYVAFATCCAPGKPWQIIWQTRRFTWQSTAAGDGSRWRGEPQGRSP